MTKQICEVCGNEYNFIEGDTPDKFALVCSDECLEKLEHTQTYKIITKCKTNANEIMGCLEDSLGRNEVIDVVEIKANLEKDYDNGSEQADEMITRKEHQLNDYLDEKDGI